MNAPRLGFSLITFAALGLSLPSLAKDWKQIKAEDGVKVYSKDVPGSDLMAFKGVKTMPVPITKVAQVLLDKDPETKKEWIAMVVDFKILDIKDDYNSITYSSYDLPWPMSDRDYVVASAMKINKATQTVFISLNSTVHPKAPKTVGVRAHLVRSHYKLVALPGNKTEVTVEIQTDPKGLLPKWLVNVIQKGWPYKTLTKMEAQAKKPQTIHHQLVKEQLGLDSISMK